MIGEDRIARVPDADTRLRRTLDQLIDRVEKCQRTLMSTVTTLGNAAATETDLLSYMLPADFLAGVGDTLGFEASGQFAGTPATDKRIRVRFGGTVIFDSGALAITSAADWHLRGGISRVTKNSQKCSVTVVTSSSVLPARTQYFAASKDLTTDLSLTITGSGTNASDVVLMKANVFKQPG